MTVATGPRRGTPPAAIARRAAARVTVALYTIVAPFGWVIVTALAWAWRRDPERRARRLQQLTARAYRFMHDWLRWLRICRFDARGALPGLPPPPFVVVANHPTLMDVTALCAALGGGFTIVKGALHRRALLRPFLDGAGHVAAADGDPLDLARVVDDSVARLRQGFPLVVFPEGTRSHRDRLLPFGRTAFEIACRADVSVVSVGIRCEPVYLSKDVTVFRPPHPTAELSLEILAIDAPAEVGRDSRALLARVEGRFEAWFAEQRARLARPDLAP